MFNFCIILNVAPHFVLAQNENELEEVLKVYKDKAVTVIKANDLEVMEFKMQLSLFSKETLLIPIVVDEDKDVLSKMINSAEADDLIEDLTNNID
jgi:hypothetical protein